MQDQHRACCDGSALSLSGAALSRRSFMAGAASVFTDAQLMDIERGNALKLLPRLPS